MQTNLHQDGQLSLVYRPTSDFGFSVIWYFYFRRFLERSKKLGETLKVDSKCFGNVFLLLRNTLKEQKKTQMISEIFPIGIPPWIVRNKELLGIHANYDFSLLHCDVLNGYCSGSKVP